MVAACANEREVAELMATVVPKMAPDTFVKLLADGEIQVTSYAKPPKPKREPKPERERERGEPHAGDQRRRPPHPAQPFPECRTHTKNA